MRNKLVASCMMLFAVLSTSYLKAQVPGATFTGFIEEGRRALDHGEPEKATVTLQQALERMQPSNSTVQQRLTVLLGLSTAWVDSGNISQAERTLLRAGVFVGERSNRIIDAQLANCWAGVHIRLGRYADARAELEKALNGIVDLPEARNITPNLFDTLATAEIYLGEYKKALPHQLEAIERWRSILPNDHSNMIKAYTALATAEYLSGDIKGAYQSMEIAIGSATKTYGTENPVFARLLQNELIVLDRLGLKKEAKVRAHQLSRMAVESGPSTSVYTRAASAVQPLTK